MPWHLEEREGEHCVIQDDTGEVENCYPDRDDALALLRALYANVEETTMQRRSFPFQLKQLDAEQGVFEGYAAIFGNVDEGGDVILPGAFGKTIQERGQRVKVTWQHDWREPIGRPLEMREDEHGLFVKGKLTLDTQRGAEALALMRDGVIDELSIGYDTVKSQYAKREGQRVRELQEVRLYEFSPVTVAMNPQARITSVKAAIAPHTTPKADEDAAWDAGAVLRQVEGREKLRLIHAWVDDDGDPEAKGSYKLPHHLADGRVVWRAVAAAGASVMGARTPLAIPQDDVPGVKRHLAGHYRQFDKDPPWESEEKMEALFKFIELMCGVEPAAEPPERALTARELRARALEIELKLQSIGGET